MKKRLAILGSTGSIGEQALDVVRRHRDRLEVVALATGKSEARLIEQAREFRAGYVAIADKSSYQALKEALTCQVEAGMDAVVHAAELAEVDQVLVAISGAAGILPTLKAVECRKMVGLANKESLVAAGEVIMPRSRQSGAVIIPVDSEHSAVFQCLRDEGRYAKMIWLTASGGPFRGYSREQLANVTPEQALQHPNWIMGPKITVDSATMMNKGLEVIEAHHLFGLEYDCIKVVLQPRSIVHSMVEFNDGSFLAHMGVPDMRIPIQYAFSYPERWEAPAPAMNPWELGELQFLPPDFNNFPALSLAYEAGRMGGTMPAVMNAANEMAVSYFLQRMLKFTGIPELVQRVMERHEGSVKKSDITINDILEADRWAREEAAGLVKELV